MNHLKTDNATITIPSSAPSSIPPTIPSPSPSAPSPIPSSIPIPLPAPDPLPAPCCSTHPHIPAPLCQETCDSLMHPKQSSFPLVHTAIVPDKGECEVNMSDTTDDSNNLTMLIDVEDPDALSWGEAITSVEKEKWLEGVQSELHSLEEMEVFQLVPQSTIPSDQKILQGKFVCRLKHNEFGNPTHHKVQWVMKGF
ncbi:hypothetical protein BJY52DRAFT_1201026 [Lactarius psammicola]|nr:hypothetical protein BJY52DRAFT_1201026 [Lactarius psammicola]